MSTAQRTRTMIAKDSKPELPRHIKLRHDQGRGCSTGPRPRSREPDDLDVLAVTPELRPRLVRHRQVAQRAQNDVVPLRKDPDLVVRTELVPLVQGMGETRGDEEESRHEVQAPIIAEAPPGSKPVAHDCGRKPTDA